MAVNFAKLPQLLGKPWSRQIGIEAMTTWGASLRQAG
jgi:hypothetical protein